MRLQGLGTGAPGSRGGAREGVLSATERMTKGTLRPSRSPLNRLSSPQIRAPSPPRGPTCEVVGDPAVTAAAAVLEAAVPGGQDVQVLPAQQGKAPAWKGGPVRQARGLRLGEGGHCLPATKESSPSGPLSPLRSYPSLLPGPSLPLFRAWAGVGTPSTQLPPSGDTAPAKAQFTQQIRLKHWVPDLPTRSWQSRRESSSSC